jgi:hypothetical protein
MLPLPAYCVLHHDAHLLIYGPQAEALVASLGGPLAGPPVRLRPGYLFFAENTYLLPETVIDDYGQQRQAPEAYDWLETQGDLFPRADVLGVLPNGAQRHVFLKELDLTVMAAFAERVDQSESAPNPDRFVRLDLAVEAEADANGLALRPTPFALPLLDRALPCYRLAPALDGPTGAALIRQLITTRRADWRLTLTAASHKA